jgi:hypothetical protein
MHDTTGLQQASLGKKSNEKSGRAIMARQREGDVANFAYYDNLARAIKYEAKIYLDLIPRIYDTQRVVRVMGEDNQATMLPLGQPIQLPNGQSRVFDLSVGKYDAMVSIGPSYTTQREEAVESMIAFIQAVPPAGALVADLLAENMDWPKAQEISRRLKMLLPPQLGGPQPTPPAGGQPSPADKLKVKNLQADLEGKLIDNRMKRHQAANDEMGFQSEQ